MTEFSGKRCEDTIPELEQMERIQLFDKNETRAILKEREELELKLKKHTLDTKSKEDYLEYIKYEMNLLKRVEERRNKLGITQKKSAIDYAIVNKVKRLYRKAIFKFSDELRFWTSYMSFCKHVRSQSCVSRMLGRMLQIHQKKEKCWHIAAQWEIEEAKNLENARTILLRGLNLHPTSPLLFLELYKLELKEEASKIKTLEKDKEELRASVPESGKESSKFKRTEAIYEQAFKWVKEIKFFINLLSVTKDYENTDALQKKIINDMVKKYMNEPLVWDTMARRELQGLPNPSSNDTAMEVDGTEQNSLRDRITSCNEVYLIAVKKLKSEEMWSLYIDCLLEINQDLELLPNLKRKLLRTALSQGHQAKLLKEQHYLHWIGLLNSDKKDDASQKKLAEVLCHATEALPNSEKLWHSRLKYLLATDTEDSVDEIFAQATKLLGEKSLSLWRMKLLHVQAKNPEKTEEFFQTAILGPPHVAKDMKTTYLEWAVLSKNIHETRDIYSRISLQPPYCIELHKKMIEIEIMQPETNVGKVRECFEIAILQFGGTNMDVWMDFVNFETNHGDPVESAKIHTRAVKALIAPLVDKFISEYSLLKADPGSISMPQKS
ncbi:U3 small nucleolar RNA-associated protein 6 homolog [Belonocnema kinseyi]|uniref:U3 small nucleolar RNA-associated protein 6 homolog n=1 Tax=Belonocnema kinseyi TaxID=2817044 RepID=UPI00143D91F4|nr:U3 small nucleolar RNA-associated protein 6 homolog [Belonocnema kinseyi]XP_033211585.1 U3 small nucleolar RNA-associated protein 6 homolog [Belonocnema kinseyi]